MPKPQFETYTIALFPTDDADADRQNARELESKFRHYNLVDNDGENFTFEVESSEYDDFIQDVAAFKRSVRPAIVQMFQGRTHQREIKMGSATRTRVARAFLAKQGYDPGYVGPFIPTVGEGSQVPFPRDHQGKPIAAPDFGMMRIPGYEWHDKSKAFHRMAASARDEMSEVRNGINYAAELLEDAADMLDKTPGETLADTYREADVVARALRTKVLPELKGLANMLKGRGA